MFVFVILHYLVSEETTKCVNSILHNVNGNFHIVIVDNDSPNNTFNSLKTKYHEEHLVDVIKNDKNGGYSSGINFGYAYAKKNYSPRFIVAMNNDMEIKQHDFIGRVSLDYARTKFSVAGPDIYSTTALKHQNPEATTILTLDDIREQRTMVYNLMKKKSNLTIKGYLRSNLLIKRSYYFLKSLIHKKENEERFNVTLHGSCYIFSPLFIENRIYALYPKTKFYCEAQILDYECKRDAMIQVYLPDVIVYHHEDVATDAVQGTYVSKMAKKYDRLLESLNQFELLIKSDNERQSKNG